MADNLDKSENKITARKPRGSAGGGKGRGDWDGMGMGREM
jgi:hypothetical protein